VLAQEIGAPPSVTPVVWRLLTNRESHDIDAAVELIDWYRARWEIEMLFHVLKNWADFWAARAIANPVRKPSGLADRELWTPPRPFKPFAKTTCDFCIKAHRYHPILERTNRHQANCIGNAAARPR
jgi:hypothetical protein